MKRNDSLINVSDGRDPEAWPYSVAMVEASSNEINSMLEWGFAVLGELSHRTHPRARWTHRFSEWQGWFKIWFRTQEDRDLFIMTWS